MIVNNVVTLADLLSTQAQRYNSKTFLIRPEHEREISYADFFATVNRAAHALRSLGIGRGDKVAILTSNQPEFLFAFFGAISLGAVAAPVNNLLKPAEIEYILSHAEAKALIVASRFLHLVQPVLGNLPDLRSIVQIDGDEEGGPFSGLRRLLEQQPAAPPAAEIAPDDEAVLLYTSGTTGKPKGVLLTHRNFIANARDITAWHRLGPSDRTLCLLPLFHVNAEVLSTTVPLFSGGSVVLPERFSAGHFWPLVARYRPNWFSAAPTVLTILLNTPRDRETLDVSPLHFCLCGTAPLPVELHKRFEEAFGVMVLEGYGLTETTCRSTFNPHPPAGAAILGRSDGYRKLGSVGLPIGNEVKVFDDRDVEVPAGVVGEVVVRGENVMKGYFRDPAATAEALSSGWLHTGDVGRKDEDGYLYITDRKKDMIIRGGENIYPREVDEVLYQHPGVHFAAAVGVPDDKYGEDVAAFIVPKEGEGVSEQEILDFCRARLADYKCPKSVRFVDDIPKGPTGKLLRRKLRDSWPRH